MAVTRRARRLTAVAVAAVLGLSACGDEDDPLADRDDQRTPSASASDPANGDGDDDSDDDSDSGDTDGGDDNDDSDNGRTGVDSGAPEIPDEATEDDEDGAEAFARYYFADVVNYAYSTGELGELVESSHPLCVVCRATVGDIASAWTRGSVDRGSFEVRATELDSSDESLTEVRLTYDRTRYVEVDADGERTFSTPAQSEVTVLLQLQWDDDAQRWLVREIVSQALLSRRDAASAEPTPEED